MQELQAQPIKEWLLEARNERMDAIDIAGYESRNQNPSRKDMNRASLNEIEDQANAKEHTRDDMGIGMHSERYLREKAERENGRIR